MRLNVDRMRKYANPQQVERPTPPEYPKGATLIRDAAGHVIRVLNNA